MSKLLLILPIVLLFGVTTPTLGNHVSGGEITYTCTGVNTYAITLNLFRDCSGPTLANSQTISFTSSCAGSASLVVNLVNVGGNEISQLCDAELGNSTCNAGALPGMQQYTYTGTIVLAPPCNSWLMTWNLCCRNPSVNLVGATGEDMYLQASVNSASFPCNSSPVFTGQPIPYVCNGVAVSYNPGVVEPDGDSLVYSFVCARTIMGAAITYTGGYSCPVPIPGITINPSSGQISFTPVTNGNFVVVIMVREYDALGNLIGTTYRDMQFVVQTCGNLPPTDPVGTITNLVGNATQTGPYAIRMCEGDNVCFDVVFSDPNGADSIALTSNVGLVFPGGTLVQSGVNPCVATICFTPLPGAPPFATITIDALDDGCPVPGLFSRSITVDLQTSTVAWPDQTICGSQAAQINAGGGTVFNWTVISGDPIVVPANFSCNPCASPTASPAVTTVYKVTSNLTGSCVNVDTVTISVVPDFPYTLTQSHTISCFDDTIKLEVIPGIPGPFSYAWTPPGNVSNPTIPNPFVTISTEGTQPIFVDIVSPLGCTIEDTVYVTVYPNLELNVNAFSSTSSVCIGDTVNIWSNCGFTPIPGPIEDDFDPTFAPGIWASSIMANAAPGCGPRSGVNGVHFDGVVGGFARILTTVAVNVTECISVECCLYLGNVSSTPACGDVTVGHSPQLEYSVSGPAGPWVLMQVFDQALWDALDAYQCFSIPIPPAAKTPATAFRWIQPSHGMCVGCDEWMLDDVSINCTPSHVCEYTWTPSAIVDNPIIDSTFALPVTATYLVINVSDSATGCYGVDSVLVTVGGIDAGPDDAICTGDSTLLTAVELGAPSCGGPAPTFSWTPAPTVSSPNSAATYVTPLTTTTYYLTYNDGCGCIATDSLTVVVDSLFADAGLDKTICVGDSVAIGGPGNQINGANYTWSGGAGSGIVVGGLVTEFVSPVVTTIYTLTLDNAPATCISTDPVTVTVNNPIAVAGPDTVINCNNPDIVLDGSGSTAGLVYLWNASAGGNIVSGANSLTPNIDAAGIYRITVTDTIAGCSVMDSLEVIADFTPPIADAGPDDTLTCTIPTTVLDGTGSDPLMTYGWSTVTGTINSGGATATPTVSDSGAYVISVTNPANGCVATDTALVVLNDLFPTADAGPDTTICVGDSVTIGGPGNGPNGVNYSWSSGAGTGVVALGLATEYVSPLVTTIYTLTLTDLGNGCTDVENVTVTVNSPIAVAGPDTIINCYNPTINLDGSGSTGGLTYLWNATGGGNIVAGAATLTPTIDAAGTYHLTVTDAIGGCDRIDSLNVIADFTPPAANAGPDDTLTCVITSLVLDGSASAGGMNYSWSTATGTISSGGSTTTPTIADSGVYVITVTNAANGCVATDTTTVVLNNIFPTADAGPDTTMCFGEFVTIGGPGNLTDGVNYSWDNAAGSGVVTLGQVTRLVSPAATTVYTVTLTDPANGCTDVDAVIVTVNNPIAVAGPDTIINCFNPSIGLNGGGSTPGLVYVWNATGGGNIVAGGNTLTPTIDAGGTYRITVTDTIATCQRMDSLVVVADFVLPTASAGPNDSLTCVINSLVLNGAGSSAGMTYLWTTSGNIVSGGATTTPTVNDSGTYIITVTSPINGCDNADTTYVLLYNVYPFADAGLDTILTCLTPSISLDGSLSDPLMLYQWFTSGTGNIVSGGTTTTPTIDAAGSYRIRVTHPVSGCIDRDTVVVGLDAGLPLANAGPDDTLTCLVPSVILDGTGSSSGPTITYAWTTLTGNIVSGAATTTPTVNLNGTYTLTVTNTSNGCFTSNNVVVVMDTIAPVADAGAGSTLTCLVTSRNLNGMASSAGMNYLWTTPTGCITAGSTTRTPTINCDGTYTITVTDLSNGCASSDFVVILIDTIAPIASAGPDFTLTCASPTVVQNGSGSSPGMTYSWTTDVGSFSGSTAITNPTITSAGNYYILVTNPVTGCFARDTAIIGSAPGFPSATVTGGGSTCGVIGGDSIFFNFTGTGPWTFTYTRNGGSPTTVTNTPLNPFFLAAPAAGTYQITAFSDALCVGTFSGSASMIALPIPTYNISGGGGKCAGGVAPSIIFTFTGAPPFNFTYTIDLGPPIAGVAFGTTFTISNPGVGTYQLASLSDGICTGLVNSSLLQTVFVIPSPSGSVSGGGTTCAGSCLPVTFSLVGVPPFNISYCINGAIQNPIMGVNANTYSIPCPTEGVYTLCALSDVNCSGDPLLFTGSAEVIINDLPNITVTGGGEICQGEPIPPVTFELQGAMPFNIWLNINGVPQNAFDSVMTNSFTFSPVNGLYEITSINDVNCVGTIIAGTAEVIIHPAPTAKPIAGVNQTYCPIDERNAMTATPAFGGEILWFNDAALTAQVGSGNSMDPFPFIGTTHYYASEQIGLCKGPASRVTITVLPQPLIDAGADITIYSGEEVELDATVSGGTPPYSPPSWSPPFSLSNATILNPVASPLETTQYVLGIADIHCASTDTIIVTVIQELAIPSGITPNGDGYNDTWRILNIDDYPKAIVSVYNRWGNLMWRSEPGYPEPWNGTFNGETLPVGSTYYVIEPNDGVTAPITGTIAIIK